MNEMMRKAWSPCSIVYDTVALNSVLSVHRSSCCEIASARDAQLERRVSRYDMFCKYIGR